MLLKYADLKYVDIKNFFKKGFSSYEEHLVIFTEEILN